MGKKKVIPLDFIPDVDSRTVAINGKEYLVSNDAMFTFYQRSMGEFSPFFLALRDEKKILGCRCTKCGLVRIPPFVTHCPDCNFVPTELIEVEQVGEMLYTPPITYFAASLFLDMAPYGRGRVRLNGADTGMSMIVYTTTGILVPGLVKQGTKVKVVFRDNRVGDIHDIFCVPVSELTSEQVAKKGLQESEINWETPVEPELPVATAEDKKVHQQAFREMQAIAVDMNNNQRARKDIAGWKRNILVKTTGGEFTMVMDDGDFRIEEKSISNPDLVMVSKDPRILLDGMAYRGAITDAVIMGKLWISKNLEFTTIFRLDRMARSNAKKN